MDICLP